jgi:hypothetical protein
VSALSERQRAANLSGPDQEICAKPAGEADGGAALRSVGRAQSKTGGPAAAETDTGRGARPSIDVDVEFLHDRRDIICGLLDRSLELFRT